MTDNRDERIERLIARVLAENALAKWREEGHLMVPVLWEAAAGLRSLDEQQRRHLEQCSACCRRLRKMEHALAPAAAVRGAGIDPEIGEVVFAVSAGDQAVTGPSAVAELERVLRDGIAGWSGRFFGEECLFYHAAREAVESAPRRRAAFCQLLRLYEKLSSPISYGDIGMEPPYWEQAGHLFRAMVGVAKAAVGWIDRPDAELAARAAACFDAAWPALQFPLPPDDAVGKERTNLLRSVRRCRCHGFGVLDGRRLDRRGPGSQMAGQRCPRQTHGSHAGAVCVVESRQCGNVDDRTCVRPRRILPESHDAGHDAVGRDVPAGDAPRLGCSGSRPVRFPRAVERHGVPSTRRPDRTAFLHAVPARSVAGSRGELLRARSR